MISKKAVIKETKQNTFLSTSAEQIHLKWDSLRYDPDKVQRMEAAWRSGGSRGERGCDPESSKLTLRPPARGECNARPTRASWKAVYGCQLLRYL